MLHKKELVLNADDTRNILDAVNIVRDMSGLLQNIIPINFPNVTQSTSTANNFDQNVHITAEFPSVTSSREIEMALESLTSRASQYIHRNK